MIRALMTHTFKTHLEKGELIAVKSVGGYYSEILK
jgi:hypothetical protein